MFAISSLKMPPSMSASSTPMEELSGVPSVISLSWASPCTPHEAVMVPADMNPSSPGASRATRWPTSKVTASPRLTPP